MTMRTYRIAVLGSALAWFLLGLHMPALHAMTHHERTLPAAALAAIALLAVGALAGVWLLLRGAGPRAG